ncbi:MAG TPA: MFS transporter [Cytophagales bacterium]|jgi:MFS family permease|nr:MFS transporter [Cytophagales bacterium]
MPVFAEKLYNFITEDDDASVCEDIPDESCHEIPKSFLLNAGNGASTKLAEQLVSPSITLPWMFSFLGAPPFLFGWLVPLKNIGSLLPQLFVSGRIRTYPIRKYFWALAGVIQAVCLVAMALSIAIVPQIAAWIIVVLLLLFSIASGVGSIAFKEVLAKTISKGERGQLLATRAFAGGVLALLSGAYLKFFVWDDAEIPVFISILSMAALLWVLATLLFAAIHEEKGATSGGRSAIKELKSGWQIFSNNQNLRRFLIALALLMIVPLATPFYVMQVNRLTGTDITSLGILIIVSAAANIIGGPLWGRFADRKSHKLMGWMAVFGAITIVLALVMYYVPESWVSVYTFVPVFLFNSLSHSGTRLARKTYLVDFAPEKERPLYTSFSNTAIGIIALISVFLGSLAAWLGLQLFYLILIVLLSVGAVMSFRLKNVS